MKVLLIGGDKRSEFAEKEFRKAGFETETLGLYENDKQSRYYSSAGPHHKRR